jgi:hypothetical protein
MTVQIIIIFTITQLFSYASTLYSPLKRKLMLATLVQSIMFSHVQV